MAMPEHKLPSKEELAELPIAAINTYASRCALRVLPFTVGRGGFDYLQHNKEAIVASISIATMFGLATAATAVDIAEAVNITANIIDTARDDSTKATDTVATTYAIAVAIYAANAIFTGVATDAAVDAANASARSALITIGIKTELALDFKSLKDGLDIQSEGLWRVGIPPSDLSEIIPRWLNALENLGLDDYVDAYKQLLEGHPNPDRLIAPLINQWRQKYKPEFESEFDSSIKKSAVKSPKIDLSGHLSIKSELASDVDHLGRDRLVDALAELLTHKDQKAPLTIGLLGDWGAGKTTVLKILEKRLEETKAPHYSVQVFNAWSYEHTENIQAGIAQEAILGLTKNIKGFWNKLLLPWRLNHQLNNTKLYGYLVFLLVWFSIILYLGINGRFETVLEMGLGFSLSLLFLYNALKPLLSHSFAKAFTRFLKLPDYTSHVGQLPIYQQQVKTLSKLCLGEEERLLFIVDDLDRCSPDGIVKVFEAIRLVMEIEKVTVIIAIDHRIALSALAHQYKNLADDVKNTDRSGENNGECRSKYDIARDYLGKIIQLPVNLGRPDQEMVDNYVSYLFKGTMHSEAEFDDLSANNIDDTNEPNHQGTAPDSSKEGHQNQESLQEADKANSESHVGKYTKSDMLNRPPSEKPNKTMQHSLAEKTRFSELTDALDLHNPRQLKRLYSSYRLLRAYANREEAQNLKIMTMLFWLEQKYSQAVNHSDYHQDQLEDLIVELSDYRESKITNKTLEVLAQHFDDEAEYLSYKKLVKPFVLPQARQ